uniref:Uncharacterized protein n=1 Tax=Anguilla anguilla TaxID=7936 RepID=A0A0E9S338_ANGAN
MTTSLFVIGLLGKHSLLHSRRPCSANASISNGTPPGAK